MQSHDELSPENPLLLQKKSGRNAVICLLDTSGLDFNNVHLLLGGIINTLREQHRVIAVKHVLAFVSEIDIPKGVFEAFHLQSVVCLNMGRDLSNIPAFFLQENSPQAAAAERVFQKNHQYFQLDPNDIVIFAGAYPLVRAMLKKIQSLTTFYSTLFISSADKISGCDYLYQTILANSEQDQQKRCHFAKYAFDFPPIQSNASSPTPQSPLVQSAISSNHEPITPYKATLLLSKRARILLDWQNTPSSYANLPIFLAGIRRFCQLYGYGEQSLDLHVYLDSTKLPDIDQWFEKQPNTTTHYIDGDVAENADKRIMAHIQNEAAFPINEALVLISGDHDFCPAVTKEAQKGRPVLWIYKSDSHNVIKHNPLWLGAINYRVFLETVHKPIKFSVRFANKANLTIKSTLCKFYQDNGCNYQKEDGKCSFLHVCERCIDYTNDNTQAHSSSDCFRPPKVEYGRVFSAPASLSQKLNEILLEHPQLHRLLSNCQDATHYQATERMLQESPEHYEGILGPLAIELLAFSKITLPDSRVAFSDIRTLITRALAEPGNLYDHLELSGNAHNLFFLESTFLFSNYGYCLEKQGDLQKAFLYFELAYFCCCKLPNSLYQKSHEISIRFHMIRNACMGLGKLDRSVQQNLDQHHLLIEDLMIIASRAEELIFSVGIPDEVDALNQLNKLGIQELISSMKMAVKKLQITRVIVNKATSRTLSSAPISSRPLMASSSSWTPPILSAISGSVQKRVLSEQDLNLIKSSGKNAVIYLLDTILLNREELILLLGEIIHTLRQEKHVLSVSRIAVFNKESKLEKELATEFINQNCIFLNIETSLGCIDFIQTANNSLTDPAPYYSQHFKLNPNDIIVFAGHIDNIKQIQQQIKTTDSAWNYTTLFVSNTLREINDSPQENFLYSHLIAKATQRRLDMESLVAHKFNLTNSTGNGNKVAPLVQAAFNGEIEKFQQLLMANERNLYLISPLEAACLTKNTKIVSLLLGTTQTSITPYQASQLLSKEMTVMIDWPDIHVTWQNTPLFLAGLYQFCKSYGYPSKNVRIQVFLNRADVPQEKIIAVLEANGIEIKPIYSRKSGSAAVPIMDESRRSPNQEQALLIVSSSREISTQLIKYAQIARPIFVIYKETAWYSLKSNALWFGAINYMYLPALHLSKLKHNIKMSLKSKLLKLGASDLKPENENFQRKPCLHYQTKKCRNTEESCNFLHHCQRCNNLLDASENHPEAECFRPKPSTLSLFLPDTLLSYEPRVKDPSENNALYQEFNHYFGSRKKVPTTMITTMPLLYMLAVEEEIPFLLDLIKVNLQHPNLDLAAKMFRALGEYRNIVINLDLWGLARDIVLSKCATMFSNYGCCLEQLGLENEGFMYLELASLCVFKMSVKPEGMWASIRWNMLRNVSSELALQDRSFLDLTVGSRNGIRYHSKLIEGLQELILEIETRERKLCFSLSEIKALQTSLQMSLVQLTPETKSQTCYPASPPPMCPMCEVEPCYLEESKNKNPAISWIIYEPFCSRSCAMIFRDSNPICLSQVIEKPNPCNLPRFEQESGKKDLWCSISCKEELMTYIRRWKVQSPSETTEIAVVPCGRDSVPGTGQDHLLLIDQCGPIVLKYKDIIVDQLRKQLKGRETMISLDDQKLLEWGIASTLARKILLKVFSRQSISGSALPMSTYSENDVFDWLNRKSTIKSVLDSALILRQNRIDGDLLLSLTDLELQQLGCTAFTRNWIMRRSTTEREVSLSASSSAPLSSMASIPSSPSVNSKEFTSSISMPLERWTLFPPPPPMPFSVSLSDPSFFCG